MVPRLSPFFRCIVLLTAIGIQRVVSFSPGVKRLALSMQITARNELDFRKNLAKTVISSLILWSPIEVNAVPLGTHTTCAWPTCTSQLDILKDNAPSLVSQVERDDQLGTLKDIEFTLRTFPILLEQKDYFSMRSGLRSSPAAALRLTSRKVRNMLDSTQREIYVKAYQSMIENMDNVDTLAGKRLQDSSSDAELKTAITEALSSYSAFLSTVVFPPLPPAVTAESPSSPSSL